MSKQTEDFMETVNQVKTEMLSVKVQEHLLDAVSILSQLGNNDMAYCHAIMALHYMLPETPMPQTLLNFLSERGLTPNVRVQTEEEEKALLQQSGCTCEKCQELRAKYNIAPPVPVSTQVH